MEEVSLTKKERRALSKEQKKRDREQQLTGGRLKKIAVLVVVVSVISFLGFRFWNWLKTPTPQVSGESVEVVDADWVRGNAEASVNLIEYSDFQCPACKSFYPVVKALSEEYPDDLVVVYRHFPLKSIHRNAFAAAKASEAAGKQNKFWEMHDLIFDNQEDWENERNPKDKFTSYAKELELDEEKFFNDFESSEVESDVNSDLLKANSLGVNSTPTFYLNGNKIQPGSYDDLKNIIEVEITKGKEGA